MRATSSHRTVLRPTTINRTAEEASNSTALFQLAIWAISSALSRDKAYASSASVTPQRNARDLKRFFQPVRTGGVCASVLLGMPALIWTIARSDKYVLRRLRSRLSLPVRAEASRSGGSAARATIAVGMYPRWRGYCARGSGAMAGRRKGRRYDLGIEAGRAPAFAPSKRKHRRDGALRCLKITLAMSLVPGLLESEGAVRTHPAARRRRTRIPRARPAHRAARQGPRHVSRRC